MKGWKILIIIERELVEKTMVHLEKDTIQSKKSPPKPYVVVSCNAFSNALYVQSILEEMQLSIEAKYLFHDYFKYANAIYNLQPNDIESHLWLALLLERYGSTADHFQVWFLSGKFIEITQLKLAKWRIRKKLGFFEQIIFEGREFEIQHHYLHCPEEGERDFEYGLLGNFKSKKLHM